MRTPLFVLSLSLAVTLALSGCAALAPRPTPPPPPAASLPTAVPARETAPPTATPAPTALPAPSAPPPAPTPTPFDYAGWPTWASTAYGFSFRYPPDWTVLPPPAPPSTMVDHLVQLEPPAGSLGVLSIAFKRAAEDQQITRTGVGSGDLLTMGSVAFLGEEVDRVVLVAQGQHHGVLYDAAREIERDGRAFTVSLDLRGDVSRGQTLSAAEEEAADLIVASFVLTE